MTLLQVALIEGVRTRRIAASLGGYIITHEEHLAAMTKPRIAAQIVYLAPK